MSFEEFEAVYNAYATQRNFDMEGEWERMRLLATIVIQPHLSKGARITPQKLLPLPWDKKDLPIIERTPAEQRKRAEELMERLLKTSKK